MPNTKELLAKKTELPSDMTGATSSSAGAHGLVPAPTSADYNKYLRGDGTWGTPQGGGGGGGSTVTYTPIRTTGSSIGTLVIDSSSYDLMIPRFVAGTNISLTPDAVTGTLTISASNPPDMVGASSSTAGTHGLVPAPSAGANDRFLRSDGAWIAPNTTVTFMGDIDPAAALGKNGDIYFKYTSRHISVENTITLPTMEPTPTYNYIEIADFSAYTDFTFSFYDNNHNYQEVTVDVSDMPTGSTPEPGTSSAYTVYISNSYMFIAVSKGLSGLWVNYGEYTPIEELSGTYEADQITSITKSFAKLDGAWFEQASGGGGGSVNDVEVDGVSVVNASGVAEIDLTGKQNALTAGTNISIDTTTNTISATDTTYSDFAGSTHGLVPAVQTQAGKYLKDDGTWGTPGGSGGSEVIANPSGTATDVLNKIEIDDVIYSLPSGGGGGGSFVGLTKTEYDALPTSEKEDTTKLYFVQEGGAAVVTDLVGTSSDWGMYREGSMTITWNNNDEIVFDWVGGSSIGGDIVKKVTIPANASKIRFKITTGSAYDTNTQRFKLGIGVRTTYTTSVVLDGYNVTDWLAFENYNVTNSIWEDELDLSNVTVDTYLYIIAHGWDATVNKLEVVTPATEATYYTYWNNAKRAQWNQVKELTQGEYNALSTDEKQNGNLYLTHDGGYDFISYDNGKIVVRVNNTTGQTLWFFNGFYKDSPDLAIPSELLPYLPNHTTSTNIIQAKSWTDDTSTSTNGWIGFVYPGTSNVKIRSWSTNFSQLIAGTFWAVLDIDGSSAEGGQTANYSSPTEGLSLLPNRVYFNGTKYAENSASGSGSNYSRTVLYNTDVTSAGQFTLNDDITNYDEIEIVIGFTNGTSKTTFKFNSAWFKNEFPYVAGATSSTNHFLACVYATYYIRLIMGDADNKLYMTETNDLMIEEVAGITY